MNRFGNIILFAGSGLLIYSLLASVLHMPMIGTFLLVTLVLCGVMMLFMNHSGSDKKDEKVHHH